MSRSTKQPGAAAPGLDLEGEGPAPSNVPEYSVSELSGAIKRALEDGFGFVRLRGEVSGYRGPHASGHCYFALKDEKSKIDAVVWRGVFSKLRVKPEEGMEVVVQGKVTSYPGSSKYQIMIETLEPAGVGALMAILEARKAKLAAEGLFDEARKRPIPFLPRVIGIVTSPTGAVIRDMLAGFEERFPARVVVWPVRVQGETSAGEVAAAVRGFNRLPQTGGPVPRPDILIVARGGGSLEDLWGFNEEAVVRAVAESRLPVISAVGHETDWTLIDLVADARAPTPTKAAEWSVPKYSDLVSQIQDLNGRLRTATLRGIEGKRTDLKAAARGLPKRENLLALPRQTFDALDQRLPKALIANTRAHHLRAREAAARLRPGLLRQRVQAAGERLRTAEGRGREALIHIAGQRRRKLDMLSGRLSLQPIRFRLQAGRERLEAFVRRGELAFSARIETKRRQVSNAAQMLGTLSYQGVLARGYVVARDSAGRAVRSAAGLAAGAALELEFHDGRVDVTVQGPPGRGNDASGPTPEAAQEGATAGSGASSGDIADGAAKVNPEGEPLRGRRGRPRPAKPEQGSLF